MSLLTAGQSLELEVGLQLGAGQVRLKRDEEIREGQRFYRMIFSPDRRMACGLSQSNSLGRL